jgi:hypothetical protein
MLISRRIRFRLLHIAYASTCLAHLLPASHATAPIFSPDMKYRHPIQTTSPKPNTSWKLKPLTGVVTTHLSIAAIARWQRVFEILRLQKPPPKTPLPPYRNTCMQRSVDLLRHSPNPLVRLAPLLELDSFTAGKASGPERSLAAPNGVNNDRNSAEVDVCKAAGKGIPTAEELLAEHRTLALTTATDPTTPTSPFAAV